jgi:putative transposase
LTGSYLITAATYNHAPILANDIRKEYFEKLILSSLNQTQTRVQGWVILPNHYHILVDVDCLDTISMTLKKVHGITSRHWNIEDNCTKQRTVWYKFSDRAIRNEKHFYRVLNYIHYNPVKHGLVDNPYCWKWTSLPIYYDGFGREWLRRVWADYSCDEMGEEWDIG